MKLKAIKIKYKIEKKNTERMTLFFLDLASLN